MSDDTSRNIEAWPVSDRPRERLLARGPQELSDTELLAVLLGTGEASTGRNALDLARDLLKSTGGLDGLTRAGGGEISQLKGVGPAKAARVMAGLEVGRRAARQPVGARLSLRRSEEVYQTYQGLGESPHEVFLLALLDTRSRLIRDVTVAQGGFSAVMVLPREVFRPAIREAATAVICVHNHPSGDPSPSREDIELTSRLVESGRVVGIPVVDHVVVGRGSYFSFADEGLIRRQ